MNNKKISYIISAISLLLFTVVMILVLNNSLTLFDNTIYNFLISKRCDFLDIYFKTITKLGNTVPVLLIVIILLITLNKKDKILLGSSAVLSVVINTILKNIVERPRPDHLRLITQGGYSFPSGHAMISICVYGTLIYIINKNIKNKLLKTLLTMLLLIIIISIGLSRIYVGVHYPSDILGGYLLSLTIVIININLYHKYIRGN